MKIMRTVLSRGVVVLVVALASAACIEVDDPYEPNRPEDVVEVSENHRQVIVRDVQTGQPVLIFNFEQTRTETNGLTDDATTTLFIQNVSDRTLRFTYSIDVYSDLGSYAWSHAGYVSNLPPGAGTDEGVTTRNKMHLKFAVFQIYAQ